jgi:hypothetical protein
MSLHRTRLHRMSLHRMSLHRMSLHRMSLHRMSLHRMSLHRMSLHRTKLRGLGRRAAHGGTSFDTWRRSRDADCLGRRSGNADGLGRRGRFGRLRVFFGGAHGAHRSAHARAFLDAQAGGRQVACHFGAGVQNERFARGQISFDLTVDVNLSRAHGAEHHAAFGDAKGTVEIDVSLHAANNFEVTGASEAADDTSRASDDRCARHAFRPRCSGGRLRRPCPPCRGT